MVPGALHLFGLISYGSLKAWPKVSSDWKEKSKCIWKLSFVIGIIGNRYGRSVCILQRRMDMMQRRQGKCWIGYGCVETLYLVNKSHNILHMICQLSVILTLACLWLALTTLQATGEKQAQATNIVSMLSWNRLFVSGRHGSSHSK